MSSWNEDLHYAFFLIRFSLSPSCAQMSFATPRSRITFSYVPIEMTCNFEGIFLNSPK